ncbi:hypothetical protein D082_26920 [Synechocystis sp. PCC 6714]|nr:hypothetical protein D082_26920 [Synechocystis sp. PCC 6714]
MAWVNLSLWIVLGPEQLRLRKICYHHREDQPIPLPNQLFHKPL